jgi:hypothetical protein
VAEVSVLEPVAVAFEGHQRNAKLQLTVVLAPGEAVRVCIYPPLSPPSLAAAGREERPAVSMKEYRMWLVLKISPCHDYDASLGYSLE